MKNKTNKNVLIVIFVFILFVVGILVFGHFNNDIPKIDPQQQEALPEYEKKDTDKDKMKLVVCLGDSITEGKYIEKSYSDVLNDIHSKDDILFINRGISGSSVLPQQGNKFNDLNKEIKSNEKLIKNADLVTIFTGTNDYGLNKYHKDSNTFNKDFVKQLSDDIDLIKKINPNVKILGILPLTRFKIVDNPNVKNINVISKLEEEVFKEKNVLTFDFDNYVKVNKNSFKDNLHPTQETQNLMANALNKFLIKENLI